MSFWCSAAAYAASYLDDVIIHSDTSMSSAGCGPGVPEAGGAQGQPEEVWSKVQYLGYHWVRL